MKSSIAEVAARLASLPLLFASVHGLPAQADQADAFDATVAADRLHAARVADAGAGVEEL